jgi:hypothetical protein
MAPIKFGVEVIRSFLRKHRIATLAELKQALGTLATMTVFRKLKALGYRTSLSHRGKYYTLADIPQFDEQGLWSHRSVWFSQDGTLLATAQRFVEEASAGLTASELQAFLPVEVKEALLHLYRQERIDREEIGGGYVYFARDSGIRRNQKMRRLERPAAWELGESLVGEDLAPELKAAMILFFSLLDERQRRLYAGLEAHKLGYGGDRKVAWFLGLDEHTVARGRQELFSDQVQRERIRNEGGGRKAVEKKRPK